MSVEQGYSQSSPKQGDSQHLDFSLLQALYPSLMAKDLLHFPHQAYLLCLHQRITVQITLRTTEF